MEDQNIECKECGRVFVWTASEQAFFKQKGFENTPARCPECRKKAKERRLESQAAFSVECSSCGQKGEVPFEPDGKPVYCEKCFLDLQKKEENTQPSA